MTKQTIGLMMVVRNEANRIIKFLDKNAHYFDQVVIVDQDSDDSTTELLQLSSIPNMTIILDVNHGHCEPSRKYAGRVLKTDWFLYADPDEEYPIEFLKSGMRKAVETDRFDGYFLKRKNSFDVQVYDYSVRAEPKFLYVEHPAIEKQFRLIRRSKATFSNKLHSSIGLSSENWRKRIGNLDYIINHRKTLDEQWSDMRRYDEVRARGKNAKA